MILVMNLKNHADKGKWWAVILFFHRSDGWERNWE